MEKWLDPKTITLWIIIVLALITLLAVSFVKLVHLNFRRMVENKLKESRMQIEYQKKLLETGIIAQEQERTRIAADLHDSLIGKLTIIRLKNQTEYNFDQIDSLLGESINEARRISHDLSPPMIGFTELDELVDNIIATWKKQIPIIFHKHIYPDVTIHPDVKIQAIRIVQELLVNIHKHSGASLVHINLKVTPSYFALVVSDNGNGFDINTLKKGIGLKNIELRMLYLKGHHKIKTGKNGTTAILIITHADIRNERYTGSNN
jgi:two-component system NarL family sensor kinase